MKYLWVLILGFAFNPNSFAARNYILAPTQATFEYPHGNKIEIKASADGAALVSLVVTLNHKVVSVPMKDLQIVKNPVLNNVSVAGGTMGSAKDSLIQYVTLGYGTYQCYSGICPNQITYVFENGAYARFFTTKNP